MDDEKEPKLVWVEYDSMSDETDGAPSVPVKIQTGISDELSAELVDLLESPRLLPGENENASTQLTHQIRSAVAPKSFIEELLARDIAYLTWDIIRLRRLRAELVMLRRNNTLYVLAKRYLGESKAQELHEAWTRDGNPGELEKALLECGIDNDSIDAETLARNFDEIAQFDRLIASAEGRRNALFREIDRHRDAVQMRRLREVVTSIEDAEFEEVTTPQPEAAE